VVAAAPTLHAQEQARPPVIDMHVHGTMVTPGTLPRLDSLNVRYFFLGSLATDLAAWAGVDTSRYVLGLVFPCERNHAPISGRPCFAAAAEFPDTTWLRSVIEAGRIRALGELAPQYMGIAPDDPRLEPYWALAEKYDLPVAIHMGMSEPGIAYDSSGVPWQSHGYRMRYGDPLLLEDVLARHQHLRMSVMHAGYPRLESMVALLSMYPNVYVDVAALQNQKLVPRGRRIMFGSDFLWQLPQGIAAIEQADFLTPEQKSDILCNNAARFLRRPAATCTP
jgi:hypothetical protein